MNGTETRISVALVSEQVCLVHHNPLRFTQEAHANCQLARDTTQQRFALQCEGGSGWFARTVHATASGSRLRYGLQSQVLN